MTKAPAERSKLLVTLRLLTTAEGGRETPVIEALFKPRIKIGDVTGVCIVDRIEGKTLRPGESAEAVITLIGPSLYGTSLVVGADFEVLDGIRVVGRGTIHRMETP